MENAILSREVQSFLIGVIRSFVRALEASSEWTAGHTERVTGYAVAVGRLLGFSPAQIERLRICSLLHDIGKIATPDEILNKDEQLSEEEWEKIRQHPVIGAEILSELRGFIDVVDCIRYHHERYDGKGLHGLKGDDIPLKARILAVCDAFDAMTSDRPYRRRLSAEEAIAEIEKEIGRQFDPEIANVFSSWIRSSYGIKPSDPEPDA
jgi:putative nucleotidyltransferase with HDIG domain